mgnify:CR=1 FL=1
MPEMLRLEEGKESFVARACAGALSRGSVVVLPTDTVYGLAARVDMPRAVRRIFEVKGRDVTKALVVMVGSVEEATALAAAWERENVRRLGSFWPGPLTLVVEAAELPWREAVAPASDALGIRVPGHPFLLDLLSLTGPLAVTSANPSGEEAPAAVENLDDSLLEGVDLVVCGGPAGSGRPSTVAEIRGGELRILRPGDIGEEELLAALLSG